MAGKLQLKIALCMVGAGAVWLAAGSEADTGSGGVNCSFRSDPDAFLSAESRARAGIRERVSRLDKSFERSVSARNVAPGEIPKRSFIDVEIFDAMAKAGLRSAPPATDEEFLRRIYLDLTGRIPSPDEVRGFLSDASPDKRTAVIDRLLYSPEFTDKWTMWLGDLLENTAVSASVNRQVPGRNAFHNWIWKAVADGKPLKEVAFEVVAARGSNYNDDQGATGFSVGARTTMGPIQDNYDMMLNKVATTFLGMAHFDCVVCHDGRRHLDQLSLWGKEATRLDAYKMAAFFSRIRQTTNGDRGDPLFQSFVVTDVVTGAYDLNTNFGNRPNRVAIGALRTVTPEYWVSGAKPPDGDWRVAFAENLMRDPMMARNLANRIWREVFQLALVEPVDGLDPARLDPKNPPPAPWSLQAVHPQLLEQLSRALFESNYNLREFLRLLTESSAYQLSSRYEDGWKADYVPYFARHYARRMEGEEVHDAIVKATGIFTTYTVQGWGDPVRWAIQLPEPAEPRGNGASLTFLNAFFRGNRDGLPRSQSGSIFQQLYLMNDVFVTNRVRVSASPTLQAASRLARNDELIDEIFLLFLSRRPSAHERGTALSHLQGATTAAARNTAIEDLAWACLNKSEFILSY